MPDNFVPRPAPLKEIKAKLFVEDDQTLVVSAISGLGGLGKSVLAAAIALDPEVQEHFTDGILWVTLGQNPDLQTMLGDWIRELDKSRDAFSISGLQEASRYLHNLLVDRRMLLVVDDVWNAAHAEWFRVGGKWCRILITTREAVIARAYQYDLDLMSPQESLKLIQGELGPKWTAAMEKPALEFAKLLGYLPLALRLMAVQVARGRKWETLKKAFLNEVKRLRSLDYPNVRIEELSEEEQRQYSLQVCLQISLDRLKEDSLDCFNRFVWLGILPEDVTIHWKMATTLWDLEDWEAEETLLTLYERSFLIRGLTTLEGEPTYRLHDLMHKMASDLIEDGILESTDQQLEFRSFLHLAHRQFLERYRLQAEGGRWDRLPDDGYIYRHLTWHMEQANWINEIHKLIFVKNKRGRNVWFETCDRIGQPAIFVEDLARGWRLAEQSYEHNPTQSIIFQCRYALISSTLNTLLANLPVDMMIEFVKHEFWTVEQAWAYVEQMQNDHMVANAIELLTPYLSNYLLQVAADKARKIQDEFLRASALIQLAKFDDYYFSYALAAARRIPLKIDRATALANIAKLDKSYFSEALIATEDIQNTEKADFFNEKIFQAKLTILAELIKIEGADFTSLLATTKNIDEQKGKKFILHELIKMKEANLSDLLGVIRSTQDKIDRASLLVELVKLDDQYFDEAFTEVQTIEGFTSQALKVKASLLFELAKSSDIYFDEAFAATQKIIDEDETFIKAQENPPSWIQKNNPPLKSGLVVIDPNEEASVRAFILIQLAKFDKTYFDHALDFISNIASESTRASSLIELAKVENSNISSILAVAEKIQHEDERAFVLINLLKSSIVSNDHFLDFLLAARRLKDPESQATILSELAMLDNSYFNEAFSAAQRILNNDKRLSVLIKLAKTNGADLYSLLDSTRAIQDDYNSSKAILRLMPYIPEQGSDVHKSLKNIQDRTNNIIYAYFLAELARNNVDFLDLAIDFASTLESKLDYALILGELSCHYSNLLSQALVVICSLASIDRYIAIKGLANDLPIVSIRELKNVVNTIEDHDLRADILEIIEQKRNTTSFFSKLDERSLLDNKVEEKISLAVRADGLSKALPSLPLCFLPLEYWEKCLHILSTRQRSDLMLDLATLYPAIKHLGGDMAPFGVIDTIREVCSQWK